MRRRTLVIIGALAFVATLLLHMPAALVYGWSTRGPAAPKTVLHGLQGTIEQGSFAALSINGRQALGAARWTLHPLWLALLRLSADIEAGGSAPIRVRISRAPFGTLRLSGLSAAGDVKSLLGVLGQPALPVDGQARLDLPLVRLDKGVPVEAEGSAQIDNLAWTLAREPLPLGSFTADLSTDDKGIAVKLGSGPGPLELSGTATLAPTRAYEVIVQMRSRPPATAQLQTLLQSLGAPDAQGWYHLRRSGTLQ